MIIVDFQNIMLANLAVQLGFNSLKEVEPDLLRHMVLNSLRAIRSRYKNDYGELVIACEERSWRREIFPYYKASRDKSKETSDIDWDTVFKTLRMIRSELKEVFPYRVIEAEGAEADDVIGTLVMDHGTEGLSFGEKILIISGDKDFAQLLRYANVEQYDWVHKRKIVPISKDDKFCSADEFLLEHIIHGDTSDGVPNILSDDDVFIIEGKRQKPITAKRRADYKAMFGSDKQSTEHPDITRKFDRNRKLIDLRYTPLEVRERIRKEFDSQAGKGRAKLFNYFVEKKLKNLLSDIGDF